MGWWRRMVHPWRSLRRQPPQIDADEARRLRVEAERKLAETAELTDEVHEVSRRIEDHRLNDGDTFARLFDAALHPPRRPKHR